MDQFTYTVAVDPKMLRETLLSASYTMRNFSRAGNKESHLDHLKRLIDECDRKRPLGPDGKHGKRHTEECGCDDR